MNRKQLIAVICLIYIFCPIVLSQCFPCSFDTDCEPGSKCIKAAGSIYGICKGGLSPGNENDNKPVYAPLDLDKTYGNTCQFDTDCGVSNSCIKSTGSIYGVCMKKVTNAYINNQNDTEQYDNNRDEEE